MTADVLLQRIARGEYPELLSEDQRRGAVLAFTEGCDERFAEEASGRDRDGLPTSWLVQDADREHLVIWVPDEDRSGCDCARFRKVLRGAPCAHLYAIRYRMKPPTWDPNGTAPIVAAKRLPVAAAVNDLPANLTERADAYSRSLVYVEEQFYPFLNLLLGWLIPDDQPGPRGAGRPRKNTRAVIAALCVKVRERKSLRATGPFARRLLGSTTS